MAGDLILDTSVVVRHLRGNVGVTVRLQAHLLAGELLYLPLVVWGELLYGARRAGQPERELASLAEFARATARLYPTERTASAYAEIKNTLAQAGALIPENDLWIAALALEHGLPLAACDEHFARISGITLLDWSG